MFGAGETVAAYVIAVTVLTAFGLTSLGIATMLDRITKSGA
jgi:hypothetical protein